MAENQPITIFDRPGAFGKVRFFDVGMPSGQFASVDRICQFGWHEVNDLYQITRPNGHRDGLLIFTIAGEGWISVNHSAYTAKAGTVTLIPPDTVNAYGCAPGSLWEFYWIHYSGKWSNTCVRDILRFGSHVIPVDVHLIHEQINRCISNTSKGVERELDESEWLGDFLRLLLKKAAVHSFQPHENEQIHEILSYMESHFAEPPSLRTLAETYHYSEEHIIRMLKKQVGMSPYQYWVLQKLRHSCRDLVMGQKSLLVIAQEHGYKSPGSYTKQFQKHFGMTPAKYREVYGILQN